MCHALIIEDDCLTAQDLREIALSVGAITVDQAPTEEAAIALARVRRPAVILSDVQLAQGTGPRAVATIVAELGSIPTLFSTSTPEACKPAEHVARIIAKPVIPQIVRSAFQAVAPA